ncbi:F-box domain containing protein, partial [Tanacetum coccineum]
LLHGRDLLLHGLRWQVGNGRNISFWTHKGVSFSKDFYIHSPLGPFHNGNTVVDFIEDGEWNVRLLREHISATEAEMVLQIPISRTSSTDKLVWNFDPKGQYIVKSGYKHAIALKNTRDVIGESSTNPSSKFWKVIWSINIYGIIQSFIDGAHSVQDVSRALSVFATICWFIWRSRNSFVFDNVPLSPHNTLASIFAQLNDYQNGYPLPLDLSVKLNCDAAFKCSKAAFGIVARDSTGYLRYVLGKPCHAISHLHAEIIAVHYACSLASDRGWFNATVESDSQLAISLACSEATPPWSLAALFMGK